MNEQSDFERFVADQLGSAGVGTPPESAIEDTIARAGGIRRLPEWLVLLKEPPMRTNSHVTVGSPTVRLATILAATMLLAVALAAAGAGVQRLLAAGPIVVAQDGSGTVETISAAVAMAKEGDEILVKPGTYVESVTVDKDITITGDGAADEIVIEIAEDGPTDAAFFYFHPRYAFFIDGADATVGNLTVVGPRSNVSAFIVNGGSPTIHDVVANLEPLGSPGGFVLMDGGAGVIRDNTTDLFLWVDGGSTPEIVGNVSTHVIRPNGVGTDPWIHGNVATGVWVHDGSASLVEDNDITGSRNPDCAIEAAGDGASPVVRNNRISGNDVAICTYDNGTIAELTGNTITGNGIALRLVSSPDVPELAGNTICDNETELISGYGEPVKGGSCGG